MEEVRPGEEMGEWKKIKCRQAWGGGSHVVEASLGKGKPWQPGEEDNGSLSCLCSIWYFLLSMLL